MNDQRSTPSDEQAWSVGRLLTWTADYFAGHASDSPRLDAEVLLAESLGCKRIELYTRFDEAPPEPIRTKFRELVRRRAAGTPVAHLVGHREFYSLEFVVTPDVLIPRPETEQLVVAALDWLKAHGDARRVADVGTGSGAIAVALAKHAPRVHVTAIDISAEALSVAQQNAERHGVAEQVDLLQSDLFASVDAAEPFDLIVSNPPYVTTNELMDLDPSVRDHEPRLALDGGPEGTTVIERLLAESAKRLAPGGALMLEIGPSIAERAAQLAEQSAGLRLLGVKNDLAGHARLVIAEKQA